MEHLGLKHKQHIHFFLSVVKSLIPGIPTFTISNFKMRRIRQLT